MGPGAGNAEGEAATEGTSSPVRGSKSCMSNLKLSSLGGVFVSTTSRLGTPA